MQTKICGKCKVETPISEFYKNASAPDGRHSNCKSCHKTNLNAWYTLHKEEHNERGKRWREDNKDHIRESSRAYREEKPHVRWDYYYRTRYGITLEQYNSKLESQGGVCAICGLAETKVSKGVTVRLSVDHCHLTSEVRGLLCSKCNSALGLLGEDAATMECAAQYLESKQRVGGLDVV